jgi:uncharacterized protein (TIGR02594 family)
MMNPLACVRYAIGAKTTIVNIPERVTMYGYDVVDAPSAKYVNLFSEHDEASEYAPYLPKTDTARQYGEGVPDPARGGFWHNLDDQLDRALIGRAKLVETDNRDAYRNAVVLKVFDRVASRGLRVICKNPGMSDHDEDSTELLKPAVVASAIIEEGDVTPGQFHRMRVAAGRPELPVTFVSFGSGRSWALGCAAEISAAGYVNMGVTYDRAGEYGGDDEIVLVPISPTQRPGMAEQDPPWIKTARGFIGTQEVSGSGDNPLILQWPGIIAAKFPNVSGLNSYCSLYTNDDIAWCGLFTGVCFSINGIMPVFGDGDLQRFLWAQAWKSFGVRLDAPRLGCVAILARHVGFYVGEEGGSYLILGGNQSDGVNIKRFAKDAIEEFRWPDAIAVQPSAATLVQASAASVNLRRRMAKAIVDFEARRDSQGRLQVYQLPAGDGGGTYEVAGINDRYHPTEAAHLAALIGQGRYDEAETYIADFLVAYTDVVVGWSDDAGVEFNLRDCAFNRGPTGSARIFQRALIGLGYDLGSSGPWRDGEDGEVGELTLAASAASNAAMLITRLRTARESYERNPVGRDETSQFWRGLVNRWNNVLTLARRFSAETPLEPIFIPPQKPTGKDMPPDAPTKFNPAVEDAIAKIRPILEEALAVAQSSAPTAEQALDDIITRLGGTPPKRSTVPLITGPSGNVGGTAVPVSPAAPSVLPGLAGGLTISGLIGALMGTGTIGTPFGMGIEPTTAGTLSAIAGMVMPFLGLGGAGGTILNVIKAVGPAISAGISAMRSNKAQ